MKISELIEELEKAKREYGDLPITDFGGFIKYVNISPAKDGICYPMRAGTQNEIGIEISS